MANPLVQQGTLNRLRGSVTVVTLPFLNVTAPFLGKEGIGLRLEGETTTYINTMIGAVTSPEPYQVCAVTIHLLKTQALSNLYKTQMEVLATIGDIVIRPDTSALSPYRLNNCAIANVEPLSFAGEDAGFRVTLRGYYLINASLFALT
jgi:hypothetical protein